MKTAFLKFLLITCVIVLFTENASAQTAKQTSSRDLDQYVCMPCGNDCDKIEYSEQGECTHCKMALVKKSTVVFKTISPSVLCSYIAQHPDVVLLDVRTKSEFEGKAKPDYGTLKNAINIPIQELKNRLQELESFKNKEIIVYCSRSHRSPQASYLLTQQGFSNVTNMSGGMSVMEKNPCMK
jgi:rhodanese-related sulfurtransferase/DNA-directed RNA polymerase subunit RPC12/RpoP